MANRPMQTLLTKTMQQNKWQDFGLKVPSLWKQVGLQAYLILSGETGQPGAIRPSLSLFFGPWF